MNWNKIESEKTLEQIDKESETQNVLIFKHSTRCSISTMALSRLERNWNETDATKIKPYFLDLLNLRPVSGMIAQRYGVEHQSPQVLVIKNRNCVYTASHSDIAYDEILNVTG
jgi:bacillithiol system protein YtxJ